MPAKQRMLDTQLPNTPTPVGCFCWAACCARKVSKTSSTSKDFSRKTRGRDGERPTHLCSPYKNDVSQNSGMFRFFFLRIHHSFLVVWCWDTLLLRWNQSFSWIQNSASHLGNPKVPAPPKRSDYRSSHQGPNVVYFFWAGPFLHGKKNRKVLPIIFQISKRKWNLKVGPFNQNKFSLSETSKLAGNKSPRFQFKKKNTSTTQSKGPFSSQLC